VNEPEKRQKKECLLLKNQHMLVFQHFSGSDDVTHDRDLSRRERQIMDFLFRVGRATATDVMEGLADAPSYSAVRALLRILEQKGHIRHEEAGRAYVYMPLVRRADARQSALSHLLRTFFDNSAEQAVAALLAIRGEKMSDAELERMSKMIDAAKSEGR